MIAAMKEIRWRGNEFFYYDEYTVCRSGNKEPNVFGTGFFGP
jgi:hypothetical protein